MMINLVISQYTARGLNTVLRKQYGMYKHGRSRKVYIDRKNNVVYKLPITSSNHKHNIQEYHNFLAYQNKESSIPVASCELYYTSDHVPVIVMEYVTDIYRQDKTYANLPAWAKNGTLDSYQVGYNQRGDIVAYDHTIGAD